MSDRLYKQEVYPLESNLFITEDLWIQKIPRIDGGFKIVLVEDGTIVKIYEERIG